MKLMIAVSAVHVVAFEAVPWALAANDYPEPAPVRAQRVRRNHEVALRDGLAMAQSAYATEAR